MSFVLDPQIGAVLAPMLAATAGQAQPAMGDVAGRRAAFSMMMRGAAVSFPLPDDVESTDHTVDRGDGDTVPVRWYRKRGSAPGPAVVYAHGGGMIAGSVAEFHPVVADYVSRTGVPMLSVDYRIAPEHPHPVPVEDCYAALVWLVAHAAELGVDPARVAVMGQSAGGGIAAAVTLLARDRSGPALARQLLVHPMLDDRTTVPDPVMAPFVIWSWDDNRMAWQALLGDHAGGEDVPEYAAPARMDVAGLPPAYIEVGELDIFRDEVIAYARRLTRAGTSTELHVRPGCPHEFDQLAPHSDVAERARQDRVRVLHQL